MAGLFPQDGMVDVVTPDGRTMRLPASIASQFSGLGAPPMAPQVEPPQMMPQGAPMPEAGAFQPQPIEVPPPAPVEQPNPAFSAMGEATLGAAGVPAPPPLDPNVRRPTNANDLRQVGVGGVLDLQTAAVDAQEDAGGQSAVAEADKWSALGEMKEKQNAKIDTILATRAKVAEETQQKLDTRVADYDSAVEKYANHKVDPELRGATMAWLGVALSAIGAAWNGTSKNPALDIMMARMDQNVQLQLSDRDKLGKVAGNKKTAIDMMRERASDKNAQYSLAMAGEIERTVRMGDSIVARSNVASVKAKWQEDRAALLLQKAGMVGNAVATQTAADERADKAELDRLQFKEQQRHARAQEGIAWQGQKIDREKFAWSKDFQTAQLNLEADKLRASGNVAGADAIRKYGVGAPPAVEKNPDGTPKLGPDGLPIVRAGTLTNKDGTPFLARNEENAAKMGNKIYVAGEVNDIINRILDIRDRTGGASSTFNSDERQQLDVLQNRLVVLTKSGTEGMSSDEDMKKLAATLGAADVTSFRARAAGLKEGRDRTNIALNRDLKITYNYQGDPIAFDNTYARSPAENAEIREIKKAMGPGEETKSSKMIMGAGAKMTVDKTAAKAASGDPASVAHLEQMASESVNTEVRAYAKTKLTGLITPTTPAEPLPTAGRSVARDGISQPRPQPKPVTKPQRTDSAGNPL